MTNRELGLIVREQDPLTLSSRDTVRHACRLMNERRVGATLVVDSKGRLVGIFTGRDAVRALAEGGDGGKTRLSAAMTRDPDTISPDCTAVDALRAMADGGFRHLPVVADDRIFGVVSRGDFQGLELDQFEDQARLWERMG